MQRVARILLAATLPFAATLAVADVAQNCILEGTVDSKKAAALGQNVYIAFHTARDGGSEASCRLRSGKKLRFKEPKNAMIERVPDGSSVTYHYIENRNEEPEWQLLSVTMK